MVEINHFHILPGAEGRGQRAFWRGGGNIGNLYAYGLGVPQDYTTAMLWFHQGAAAGSGLAMVDIGTLYQQGQGVAPGLNPDDPTVQAGGKATDVGGGGKL